MPLLIARMSAWNRCLRQCRFPLAAARRLFVWLACFSAAFASPSVNAEEQPAASNAPKVVAVVNGDPIGSSELAAEALRRHGSEILDSMVNRHLILTECQAKNLQVTKEEISAEIQDQAKSFGLPVDQMLKLFEEERGMSANRYSREVVWPMLSLRKLAAERIEVTQADFDRAYLAEYGEAVKCRMIQVKERGKAEQLLRQAKAEPKSFANLARKFSEDETTASVGGLAWPIRRGGGDEELEEVAFGLNEGEISEILPLGDQWMILQAVRRIPATSPSPQALPIVRQRITDRIRDTKIRQIASTIFEELQRKSRGQTVLGDAALEQQYPGVAAIINQSQITKAMVAAECVNRYGSDVAEQMITRRLLEQQLKAESLIVAPEEMKAEVVEAARSNGFVDQQGQPDLQQWQTAVTADGMPWDVYLDDAVWPTVALRKLVSDQIEVTQEEYDNGFLAAYGPRAEVLAIVLSDQRSAQEVWKMARDDGSEDGFGSLAERYSVEPMSASNRGQVPPLRQHGGQPALEKEAFALKPGEMSGIVVTGGQYVILRCIGFTEPVVSDPAAVAEELMEDLRSRKLRQAMIGRMESIRKASEVENYLALSKRPARNATASR